MIRDIAVAAVLFVILMCVVITWTTNRRRWRKRKIYDSGTVLEDTAVDPDEPWFPR